MFKEIMFNKEKDTHNNISGKNRVDFISFYQIIFLQI